MNEILEAALISLLTAACAAGFTWAMIELVRDIRREISVIHIDASSEKDAAEQVAEAGEERLTGFSSFVVWVSRRQRMWWTFVAIGAVGAVGLVVEIWLIAIDAWIGTLT